GGPVQDGLGAALANASVARGRGPARQPFSRTAHLLAVPGGGLRRRRSGMAGPALSAAAAAYVRRAGPVGAGVRLVRLVGRGDLWLPPHRGQRAAACAALPARARMAARAAGLARGLGGRAGMVGPGPGARRVHLLAVGLE